jgi:hypothetical protein
MAVLGRQLARRGGTVQSQSPVRARRGGRGRVREGSLYGALPYLAVGQGPPLVVFSGLSPEHANPTGLARRFELQTLKPMARHFTVYAVNRTPGLPAGSTIRDLAGHYAEAIAREVPGPVSVEGISTGAPSLSSSPSTTRTWCAGWCWPATACRLSPHGREVERRFAELIKEGRPRRAYAILCPTLAATPAGGRGFAVLMWLFGASQRPDDPPACW